MTTKDIRQKYFDFWTSNQHQLIPRANLIPKEDSSTLFTGSGMQPLIPYLLGQEHPQGVRLVNSQTCFRAEDIDEIGDNRHTTCFEMLGNWSLGDYFKTDQLSWLFEFLTSKLGIDPKRLYVTIFSGEPKYAIAKDQESIAIWQQLFEKSGLGSKFVDLSTPEAVAKGMQDGRIFAYGPSKNWWTRSGSPENMPPGEPGGPDSEVFYEFTEVEHDPKFGASCHPNCDCGRFLEIGNSVFMQYQKQSDGSFKPLPKQNVDFGGGLERLAAAVQNQSDIYKIDHIWPIVQAVEALATADYDTSPDAMRIIADHLRSSVLMASDGLAPSNTGAGYVMRRIIRRAVRQGLILGIEADLCASVAPAVIAVYQSSFPEVAEKENEIIDCLTQEEARFRLTLQNGLQQFAKITSSLSGSAIFQLFDTYGFPPELTLEEARRTLKPYDEEWQQEFDRLMKEQKDRSRTATAGIFKGGLADHSEQVTKYHTANHLMYEALRRVLGDHVIQRGSNITSERLRFDFSHPAKMTPEQLQAVTDLVNEQIKANLPVSVSEMPPADAFDSGALGAFGEKYGDKVKVYQIGDYSKEICGGPHVGSTGELGQFKITKEESSSAGVRRIKAELV